MENKDHHEVEHRLNLKVNGKKYSWPDQYIIGSEVRELAEIPEDDEIFLKIKETSEDESILDGTQIDLARPGIEYFYSKELTKQLAIIVNGREKIWNEKNISFEQVVILAFGSYVENQNRVFTITYKRGVANKPEGTMDRGDTVKVKNKMIFNVTATDKS